MRILILGSGARENALYHSILKSQLIKSVYALPGNGGFPLDSLVKNVSITDFNAILNFVSEKNIDLILVGSEVPLAMGIKDFFLENAPDVLLFGPNKVSAQLEASKCFSFEYMKKRNIPTAESIICDSLDEARKALNNHFLPVVIKADGLASGKGVSIHYTKADAEEMLEGIFVHKRLGEAGKRVLVQSFMQGKEVSLFAMCNGKEAVYLPNAQDYKPVFEENKGPNTGGMGAYSPAQHLTEEQISFIHRKVVVPILEDFSYTGVLYIGLMVHSAKPEDVSVVEFNCRFGDPEIQTILPLLETDIVPYLLWACGHSEVAPKIKAKDFYHVPFKNQLSVNVVLAAKGYPNGYQKKIHFSLPDVSENLNVIHAATTLQSGPAGPHKNQYVSTGGRILNIIATSHNIETARNLVYDYIQNFKEMNPQQISQIHFRKDIASESNSQIFSKAKLS